jgi:hypothetical protein
MLRIDAAGSVTGNQKLWSWRVRHADWLRFLVPVWRFFEAPTATPELQFRLCPSCAPPGPWLPALTSLPPQTMRVLFNPQGNLVLAQYAMLDQLVRRLEDASPVAMDQVKQWYPWLVLQRIVEAQLVRESCKEYQIRVLRGSGGEAEELFTSDLLHADADKLGLESSRAASLGG